MSNVQNRIVPRNVAVQSHPLHQLFVNWCRQELRFPSRESGLLFARCFPSLMSKYEEIKRG